MIEVSASALAAHRFLRGMPHEHLVSLAGCASDVRLPVRHRIFEDGGYASRFWLIQSGHVALDIQMPREGLLIVETIGMGELLGCSWLFPPYRWGFGAVTISPFEAFEFDAAAVRACCGQTPVPSAAVGPRPPQLGAGRDLVALVPALQLTGPSGGEQCPARGAPTHSARSRPRARRRAGPVRSRARGTGLYPA